MNVASGFTRRASAFESVWFFFSFSFLSFQHMVVLLKVYFHDSSCFLFFLSSFLLSLAPVLVVLFPYWEAFI